MKCWADQAYQGAGRHVRVPFSGWRLKKWKRRHNSGHAKIRCLGEQAMAVLKGWRPLRNSAAAPTGSPTSPRPSSSCATPRPEVWKRLLDPRSWCLNGWAQREAVPIRFASRGEPSPTWWWRRQQDG
ncbi:hypothetical protein ACGFR8_23295 [Streptomyces brevispora]|uniref:hypothetical protein n=1 Tax=Streptomyces brevispora TaxID=887462 RepID=UPI0037236D0E